MSLKSSMASVGFFRPIDTLPILTSRPVRFRTSLSTRDFAIGSRNRVNPATSRMNNKNSRNSHLKSFFIPALYHPRDAGDNPVYLPGRGIQRGAARPAQPQPGQSTTTGKSQFPNIKHQKNTRLQIPMTPARHRPERGLQYAAAIEGACGRASSGAPLPASARQDWAGLPFKGEYPPDALPDIRPGLPRRPRDRKPKTAARFARLPAPANARLAWPRVRRRGRSRPRFSAAGLPSVRRRGPAHILRPTI